MPIKSLSAPTKIKGAPIKNKGDAYKFERRAILLLWRSIAYQNQAVLLIVLCRFYYICLSKNNPYL